MIDYLFEAKFSKRTWSDTFVKVTSFTLKDLTFEMGDPDNINNEMWDQIAEVFNSYDDIKTSDITGNGYLTIWEVGKKRTVYYLKDLYIIQINWNDLDFSSCDPKYCEFKWGFSEKIIIDSPNLK